jgi:hypothetical protein
MTKLTDREPTQEMLIAAVAGGASYRRIWQVMHDAAPDLPTREWSEDDVQSVAIDAFIAGAIAVHNVHREDLRPPDFTEAAHDHWAALRDMYATRAGLATQICGREGGRA